jgi:DNA-binding MarR family transcriptional regulator
MSDDDARRLLDAVRRLTGTFTELGHRFGDKHGLSRSDVTALIVVTEANERGTRIGTVELARRIGVTPPSATIAIRRLITAGLLSSEPDPNDHRRVILTATPTAQAAGKAHFGALSEELLRMLSTQPPRSVRAAADLLELAAERAARSADAD